MPVLNENDSIAFVVDSAAVEKDLNENKNNDIEFSDKKEKNISSEVKKTTLKLVK